MASIKECLAVLEANNITLKAKVAKLEPHLCYCGREDQPIIVEDGEVIVRVVRPAYLWDTRDIV